MQIAGNSIIRQYPDYPYLFQGSRIVQSPYDFRIFIRELFALKKN